MRKHANNVATELLCKGRIKHRDLERLFEDKIDDETIFCTDSHKSYIKFSQNLGIELQQIKRGKHKEGIYHIQHINAFHSKLKNGWIILMVLQLNTLLIICIGLNG